MNQGIIKEFKDFILRGNVVDLAIAVVMGVAFTAVITSFVENIVTPLITMFGGEPNFRALDFTINDAVFGYGNLLTEILSFVIIAAVLFFVVVKPINMLLAREKKAAPPPPPAPLSAESARFIEALTNALREIEAKK